MGKIDPGKQPNSLYYPSAFWIQVNQVLAVFLTTMGLAVLAVALRYTFWGPDISLVLQLIFFFLLFADAVCYFVAAWGVRRGKKWVCPFTIALLVVNILAAIFDDIGLADIVVMGFNLLMLVMLFYSKKEIYGSK
jgi:hypothetical protein